MKPPHIGLASACLVLVVGPLAAVAGDAKPDSKGKMIPVYKTSYRVIDVHAHAPFSSEAAVRAHLEVLDRVGVKAFNVALLEASGWSYPGGWSEPNLLAWFELRKRFPERLSV